MTSPSYTSISYEDFPSTLATLTELSSVSLGGKILSCSDEWFAPASDLLKVGPAPSMKGQFGPKGALFDGWETRRHNPTYDWVILRLGPKAGGFVSGFDIDTANFNGNEAPEIQVFGLSLSAEEEKLGKNLEESDERWAPLLPRLPCNPSARHLYSLNSPSSTPITHIKLLMIPDGGIARFRVYGTVPPPPVGLGVSEQQTSPDDKLNTLDLAHVMNGGRVVFTSDQHFGVGANLILPGRGKDMGDGWETKRSRAQGHKDWVVIKLGEPGFLSYVEVDTAHFLGNFPESCELHATNFDGQLPSDNADWTPILSRSKLGPGKQHFFKLENETKSFSHVKLTMHPDGGIKRIRLVGRRAAPLANHSGSLPPIDVPGSSNKALPVEPSAFQTVTGAASAAFSSLLGSSSTSAGVTHVAQPLSAEGFAPYGQVIASPSDPSAPFKTVNLGTAKKYSNLAISRNLFKPEDNAKTNLHVYKCQGIGKSGLPFHVRMLERHRFSDQAFIPMTSSKNVGQEGYLVVVAKNGLDDKPDLASLAAFYCNSEQAISYSAGTWHHPMIALGSAETDFTVIVADSETNESLNCDEAHWETDVAVVGL